MIPLYKHIIQPIEASFLQAYGEGKIPAYTDISIKYRREVGETGVLYFAMVDGKAGVFTQESFISGKQVVYVAQHSLNNFPLPILISKGDKIVPQNKSILVLELEGTLEAGQRAKYTRLTEGEEFIAGKDAEIVIASPLTPGEFADIKFEKLHYVDGEVQIPYFALLINKDDERQKVQLPSHIHVIDDSKPETNDNALVYFEIGEADLHDFNEGDKLIFEIYQEDRKGYWTSKSPAFKVFETSIDDTVTTSAQEGGQDE